MPLPPPTPSHLCAAKHVWRHTQPRSQAPLSLPPPTAPHPAAASNVPASCRFRPGPTGPARWSTLGVQEWLVSPESGLSTALQALLTGYHGACVGEPCTSPPHPRPTHWSHRACVGSKWALHLPTPPTPRSPVALGVHEWLMSAASGHRPRCPAASSPLSALTATSLKSSP